MDRDTIELSIEECGLVSGGEGGTGTGTGDETKEGGFTMGSGN